MGKKVLIVILHFVFSFLIQLFALVAYIFGAKMDGWQTLGLLLLTLLLICIDFLVCRALDKGELAWKSPRLAHCADLPLMLAPCGLMLLMAALKRSDPTVGSGGASVSAVMTVVGILLVELCLLTERILLIRAGRLPQTPSCVKKSGKKKR